MKGITTKLIIFLVIIIVLCVGFSTWSFIKQKDERKYNYYYSDFIDNKREYNQLIKELSEYNITKVGFSHLCNGDSKYYQNSGIGFCATQKITKSELKSIVQKFKKLNIEEIYYKDDQFDRYKNYRIIHSDSSLKKSISFDYFLYNYERKDTVMTDCMKKSCEYNVSKVVDENWDFNYMEIVSKGTTSIPLDEFDSE